MNHRKMLVGSVTMTKKSVTIVLCALLVPFAVGFGYRYYLSLYKVEKKEKDSDESISKYICIVAFGWNCGGEYG